VQEGEREPSARWATTAVAAGSGPAFELHSKPGSNRVIYLDFDGHTITGTAWNKAKGIDPIPVAPWDADGAPDVFSTAEQDVIREVWARVAEDYKPFDVDVTTQRPYLADIERTDVNDLRYGTRVVFDPGTWYQSDCGCFGVAYGGVFDQTGNHPYYQPALVFTKDRAANAKGLAQTASHEVGHNVGLAHDGTATSSVYAGHGAWAPIMGSGHSRAITQFSKGEYSGANNQEDDFAVAGQNGLALRGDDHSNLDATATALTLGTSRSGIITTPTDVDVFKISLAAGTYTFLAHAPPPGANLDIRLQLVSATGSPPRTRPPASTTPARRPA
jgi:hypothetical protein